MPRPLHEQVVVITGASSGIGRQTALEFARRGAAVTLAARNDTALKEVALEIRRHGGKAQIIVTDVGTWEQVERLAAEAVELHGRIDTWVNNAGVSVYGYFEELTPEEMERILRTNLLGQLYGTRAALVPMRRQGQGTIINIGSEVGVRSVPLQAVYCASKAAIRGFTESVRMELEQQRSGIDITLILPGSTNTPFFDHARSKLGVRPAPPRPIYEPEVVAEAIVFAAEHPRREIFIGGGAKTFDALQRVNPWLGDRLLLAGDYGFESQKTDEPDDGRDTVFEPWDDPGAVRGRFPGHRSSWYTRVFEQHPSLKLAALGAAVGGLALLAARARRNGNGHGHGPLHALTHRDGFGFPSRKGLLSRAQESLGLKT